LALALGLTRLGVPVRIIDRTAEAGTTSRALAVQSRTLEFYRQWGLADGMVEAGFEVGGVSLWGRGKRAARLPLRRIGLGRSPFPYVLIVPQDVHEKFLIRHLDSLGVPVERQTELIGFEAGTDAVRATLRRPDGSTEVCDTPYLAGCDGARSTVRESLGIGFPGGTYSGVFYVADVLASGAPIDGELHVDLDDGDFVGVFPLKDEGHARLIGTVRPDAGREPTFDDVRGRAIEHMRLDVSEVHWFSTYHVHHRVAERFRAGRVFLLGDAAHIHSPVGGQGMNTGIGDAVNLAWKIAAVRDGAPDDLLRTYESERIGFARTLVSTTDRVFSLVTTPGALAEFVRLQVVPCLLPLLWKSRTVRGALYRTVSQIGIHYRESSLSAGRAGRIRGGDRLPWIGTSAGVDNFAPLASSTWQVHVYGTPPPGISAECTELRLPIHVFPWTPEMAPAGLHRDALYLIRPDGYVALADARPDPVRLRRFLESRRGEMSA
jgi:2-polyprenyl-6-methoxyphenol hydroxylase-like FAD-dependent oxidoreductase